MPFYKARNLSPARGLLSLPSLLLVYSLCALIAVIAWQVKHVNGVTGDEPHYLVMANGLAKHGALEQTIAYKAALEPPEHASRRFGLAPGVKPDASVMHTVAGPHGQFNVHNLGLPLLLAIPFAIGGMVGAKLFMMLSGALIVVFAVEILGTVLDQSAASLAGRVRHLHRHAATPGGQPDLSRLDGRHAGHDGLVLV